MGQKTEKQYVLRQTLPYKLSAICVQGEGIHFAQMTPLLWILHSSSGYRAEEPDRVATFNCALGCAPPNTSATNEASQLISSLSFKHRRIPAERTVNSSATLFLLFTAAKLHGPQWEHCWEDLIHRTQCWQHNKCSTLIRAGTLSFLAQEFYWLYIAALLRPNRHLYQLNISTWAGAKPKDHLEPVLDLRKSCRLIYICNQDSGCTGTYLYLQKLWGALNLGCSDEKEGSQFSCAPLRKVHSLAATELRIKQPDHFIHRTFHPTFLVTQVTRCAQESWVALKTAFPSCRMKRGWYGNLLILKAGWSTD